MQVGNKTDIQRLSIGCNGKSIVRGNQSSASTNCHNKHQHQRAGKCRTEKVDANVGKLRAAPLAKDLMQWSIEQSEENKQLIANALQNWEADRIAYMDQIILLVAITEIRKCNDIALEISMNEYIEIAKEYSSDKSYVFINGVLNKVVNDLRANNQLFKVVR